MRYHVTKTLNPNKGYPCVFRQWKAASHCSYLHGYDLIFSVTIEADQLTEEGWVFDFGKFDPLKKRIEEQFDHKMLLAHDDPFREELMWLKTHRVADIVIMEQIGIEAFSCWLAVEATTMLQEAGELGRCQVRCAYVAEHGSNIGGYTV